MILELVKMDNVAQLGILLMGPAIVPNHLKILTTCCLKTFAHFNMVAMPPAWVKV
jgi:hypothetical protein